MDDSLQVRELTAVHREYGHQFAKSEVLSGVIAGGSAADLHDGVGAKRRNLLRLETAEGEIIEVEISTAGWCANGELLYDTFEAFMMDRSPRAREGFHQDLTSRLLELGERGESAP
jgi:hypothetical protein